MTIGVGTTTSNTCFGLEYTGSLYLDGPIADGAYKEERPSHPASDARVAGPHYEYDSAASVQTKRYYAEGKLLATRMTIFGCPPVGTCETLTYVQADHLGSTSTLTDTSGKVVGRERYSAFGERRRGETPPTTDRLYTGQRLNVLSNLYHYSDGTSAGRFYDPLLARFIQPDSVTPGKGSQALNRYAYANNSPLVLRDTTGHFPCNDTGPGCGTDMTDVPLSATPGPVSMMDPRLGSTIGYYSSVYGIPMALLETTLVVEAIDDQSPQSTLINNMNKVALDMLAIPPQYGGAQAWPSAALYSGPLCQDHDRAKIR
ncbi:MAG: RHS repeat-associated core domain-containing protein [Anaerolineae bacterium]